MVTFQDPMRTRVLHHPAPSAHAQVQITGGHPPPAPQRSEPFVPRSQAIKAELAQIEGTMRSFDQRIEALRAELADAQASEALQLAQATDFQSERAELEELRAQVAAAKAAARDDAAAREIAELRAELEALRGAATDSPTDSPTGDTDPPPPPPVDQA